MSLILMFAALSPQVPPPIVETPPAARAVLIDFQPGPATCGGETVAGELVRPVPASTTLAPGQTLAPFVLTFRVAEDGRPLGIAFAPRAFTGAYVAGDDLQPALAASRFAAGQPRTSCTVSYAAVATPIATAPIDLVLRALVLPHTRNYLEAELQRRTRAASPDCFTGQPMVVRNQTFPDFAAIPQPQGALSMTVVGYDIDASGKPVKLQTFASDGNVALDAAGREAIGRSRYGSTRRTGCTYPFYRR